MQYKIYPDMGRFYIANPVIISCMQSEALIIYLPLAIIGVCLGSFAGASVWRLRARQLHQDKADGEPIDKIEYKRLRPLLVHPIMRDRSLCLNCGYELAWYDLIPIFSWLSLAGKCRKCRQPIGYMELIIELGTAALLVMSYVFWPYGLSSLAEVATFLIWIVACVCLVILFVYDLFWSLLPDRVNYSLIIIGIISAIIALINADDILRLLINIVGAAMILSGFYLVIYIISNGRWIGFGDIKLGLGLALLLADWQLALLALFGANLIGCLIVIPAMLLGKLKRDSKVPFGPLLITGSICALLFGGYILGQLMNTLV